MPNLIVSFSLRSSQWLQCCRHNISNFHNVRSCELYSPLLMCFNYLQPRLWNTLLRLSNALDLIVSSFLRSAQWLPFCKNKYLQFSEFKILQQLNSPPLMCFNYSQPRLWNHFLHPFNALNPLVPPPMLSGQWLQRCKHKYLQFSEFEILWQLHSPPFMCFNYSQPRLWNHVLYLFNALNPIVPSSLRSGQSLQCCKNK